MMKHLTILNHRFNYIRFFWIPRTMGKRQKDNGFPFFYSTLITATSQYLPCYHQCYCPCFSLSRALSPFLLVGKCSVVATSVKKTTKTLCIVVIHSAMLIHLFKPFTYFMPILSGYFH